MSTPQHHISAEAEAARERARDHGKFGTQNLDRSNVAVPTVSEHQWPEVAHMERYDGIPDEWNDARDYVGDNTDDYGVYSGGEIDEAFNDGPIDLSSLSMYARGKVSILDDPDNDVQDRADALVKLRQLREIEASFSPGYEQAENWRDVPDRLEEDSNTMSSPLVPQKHLKDYVRDEMDELLPMGNIEGFLGESIDWDKAAEYRADSAYSMIFTDTDTLYYYG